MSKDWAQDIHEMQNKFQLPNWVKDNPDKLKEFLEFRIRFVREELEETEKAFANKIDAEEIVDGLIDICVVAIGTLDAFKVNSHQAWDQVMEANMSKEVGVKPERPNPLGLPDLMKPEGWQAPSHAGNHGLLANLYRLDKIGQGLKQQVESGTLSADDLDYIEKIAKSLKKG